MLIQIPSFNGIVPKATASSLPNTAAQDAVDCNFVAGNLTSLERDEVIPVNTLPDGQRIKGGYIWTNTTANGNPVGLIFSWPYDIDAVRSPLQNDKYNRFYWTGDSAGTTEYKLLSLTQAGIDINKTWSYNIAGFTAAIAKVGVIDSTKWDYKMSSLGISVGKVKTNGSLLSPDVASVTTEFYLLGKESADFSKSSMRLKILGAEVPQGYTGTDRISVDISNIANGTITATLGSGITSENLGTITNPYDGLPYTPYDVDIESINDSQGETSMVTPPTKGVLWKSTGALEYLTVSGRESYGYIGQVELKDETQVLIKYSGDGISTVSKQFSMKSPNSFSTNGWAVPAQMLQSNIVTSGNTQLGIKLSVFLKDENGVVNNAAAYTGVYYENASLNEPVVIGSSQFECKITSTDRRTFTLTLSRGTSQPIETRAYIMTVVNSLGEESAPSDPVELSLDPGLERAVISIPAYTLWNNGKMEPPTDTRSLYYQRSPGHGFRFYRTATSSTGDTEFLYAFTVKATGIPALPGDVYIYNSNPPVWAVQDTIATAALGAACPSTNTIRDTAELQKLRGLITINNGMTAAFKGNEVWISEPFSGAIYKSNGIHTTPYQIVALVALEAGFVALTNGEPVYFSGNTPENFTSQVIPSSYPCVGKRSVTKVGNAILYLSPEGPIVINGMQAVLDTKTWSREAWRQDYGQKVVGEAMRLANYGYRLVGYFPGKADGYLFDIDDNNWTRTTSRIDYTLYLPPKTFAADHHFSALLFGDGTIVGGVYYRKFASDNAGLKKQFSWHSKDFILPAPTTFGAVQIFGTGYITVEIYVNGVLVETTPLTILYPEGSILRLRSGYKATRWSFKLISPDDGTSTTVTKFFAATAVQELRSV